MKVYEEEILEKYPSGTKKKTIIRGGTTQGHDIIKEYHHRGKYQGKSYKYNASDGSTLYVSHNENGYIVGPTKYGYDNLHNPDGPAKMVYRKGRPAGYCRRNGRLMTGGNWTYYYYNEGELITGRPAIITIGDKRKEEWYNDKGKLIRLIDHYWNRKFGTGLVKDDVYDDGIIYKSTFHFKNGVVKSLYRYSEGKEISHGMNPDVLEADFVERHMNYDEKYHILDVKERKVEYLGNEYDQDSLKWLPIV